MSRQVSTVWQDVNLFLESLRERSGPEGGYVAVMEVCGFNDRLLKRPARRGCAKTYEIAARFAGNSIGPHESHDSKMSW